MGRKRTEMPVHSVSTITLRGQKRAKFVGMAPNTIRNRDCLVPRGTALMLRTPVNGQRLLKMSDLERLSHVAEQSRNQPKKAK